MNTHIKETRRFPRIDLSAPIRYQVRGSQETTGTVTEDVSLSGVRFVNNTFLSPQTPVMLELSVLSQVLRPIAKIVWSSPLPHQDKFHLGAEFLEWDPQEKKHFSDFITMRLHHR